jgi:hypothetical protein
MQISNRNIALGAMAFGSPGVAVGGFLYLNILILVTVCGLLFVTVRWLFRQMPRRPRPLKPENTCSQELLDYWARVWPNHTSPN